jgi:hypothetical protein
MKKESYFEEIRPYLIKTDYDTYEGTAEITFNASVLDIIDFDIEIDRIAKYFIRDAGIEEVDEYTISNWENEKGENMITVYYSYHNEEIQDRWNKEAREELNEATQSYWM